MGQKIINILSGVFVIALLSSCSSMSQFEIRSDRKLPNRVNGTKSEDSKSGSKNSNSSNKDKAPIVLEEGVPVEASAEGEPADSFSADDINIIEVKPAPAPVFSKTPKVGVILGPGGIKSFAHSGVLKELEKARIPIDSIVGIEWGALVAGLYAQKGSVNEVEWRMYKMNERDLPDKGFFTSRFSTRDIDTMKGFFENYLDGKVVDKLDVPFACPALSLSGQNLRWQDSGSLRQSIESCLPYPPMFESKGTWTAAAFALNDAREYLKAKGMDVVIFINVLGGGALFNKEQLKNNYEAAILWEELKRFIRSQQDTFDLFIEVDTTRFGLFDFQQRRALVSAGERAGRGAAQTLLEKYGF